jgi:hypothetical protein
MDAGHPLPSPDSLTNHKPVLSFHVLSEFASFLQLTFEIYRGIKSRRKIPVAEVQSLHDP